MGNNMELGYEMFCYQCEQTAGGKGCTKLGVCGKTPEIAGLQDLLIFQIKGISCYAKTFIEQEQHVDKSIVTFIENALFTTLTNVNFDADAHVKLLRQSQEIKETLKSIRPIKVTAPKDDTCRPKQIGFHGTADSWAETTQIQALAKQINLPLHLIPNADHSLETGDVLKDLDILKEVMTQTFHFLKMC